MQMSEESMVTTFDNPYNPFTQYDDWHAFDSQMGYHTPEYLARLVTITDAMSLADQEAAIENAVMEIVKYNLTGNYCRVTAETFDLIVRNQQKVNSS